jgi:hypothetical protein
VGFAHQAHSRVSNIIAHAFNWFKSMGGFLHLKPTVGCQISTLICSEIPCSGTFPTQQIAMSFPEFP